MLTGQIGARAGSGCIQLMTDHVDHPPVHLLRPWPVDVAGAQAGLDLADRNAVVERGQGGGHRRGGIAVHQHAIRADLRVERVKPLEQPGTQAIEGLVGHHDIQVMVGGDLEQRHHLVQHCPVLAGDADHRFDIRSLGQGTHQRPHLDRFRSRAEHRQDLHRGAPEGQCWKMPGAVATSGSLRRYRPMPAGRRRSPHEETPNSRRPSQSIDGTCVVAVIFIVGRSRRSQRRP